MATIRAHDIHDGHIAARTMYAHFAASPVGPFQTIEVESRYHPLWWHLAGKTVTRTGYGGRIPTTTQVKINGRWRRIYCAIWSNSGTCYVEDRSAGKRIPTGGKVARYPWIRVSE